MIVIHYRKHYERKKYMSYIKINPKFKDIELPWRKDLVKKIKEHNKQKAF